MVGLKFIFHYLLHFNYLLHAVYQILICNLPKKKQNYRQLMLFIPNYKGFTLESHQICGHEDH